MSNKAAVLIVDDEASIRELIAEFLEADGYIVRQAGGGKEALTMLANGLRPDLVITDYNMPGGMLGDEVVRAVKVGHPGVAVVLASSIHPDELSEVARKAGADDFLQKPFSYDDLQRLVERLVPK